MTKEELEKEATEYAQKLGAKDFIAKPKEIVAYFGYLAGAEPREKRIEELETQIEKMKCCQNCLHYRHFTKDITECAYTFTTAQNCRHNNLEKWEIKE